MRERERDLREEQMHADRRKKTRILLKDIEVVNLNSQLYVLV